MAAPPEKTIHDLSGSWVLNRTLSGDADKILALQGISWTMRTMIYWATITLDINQYKDDAGHVKIDIEQTGTGGLKGTTERRTLVWQWAEHADGVFGQVRGRSRLLGLADLAADDDTPDAADRDFLSQGWEAGEDTFVQSLAESLSMGWTANQIWGFQEIDGQRYYCRNVVVRKGADVIRDRLVYDYK